MTKETMDLVHKLDDIPKKDFRTILPQGKEYMSTKERDQIADLLEKLLNWIPSKRISCE
jgi:hypothetical protein